nr:malignant T-cell-amplified sequence 1 homolog [Ipomoea batatas]
MAGEDATFFLVEDCDFVVNLMPMFSSEEVSGQNQVKASVQRKIRQSIAEEYPGLEPVLDDLLPKKSPLIVAKCFMFSFLYADPNIMKKLQVDRGAIKYVLSGANIMCPGLTSPGGALDVEVGAETPVVRMIGPIPISTSEGEDDVCSQIGPLNFPLPTTTAAENRTPPTRPAAADCSNRTTPPPSAATESAFPISSINLPTKQQGSPSGKKFSGQNSKSKHLCNAKSGQSICRKAIMAEGKQHALAIGFTKMSAKDINSKDDRKELSARTKVKAAAHHQELQKVFAVSIA